MNQDIEKDFNYLPKNMKDHWDPGNESGWHDFDQLTLWHTLRLSIPAKRPLRKLKEKIEWVSKSAIYPWFVQTKHP
jgi:hypothetical protein